MKALGIVAIVVSAIAVVIPVFGASWLPLIAGIMAVIAVREEHVLAFVALGVNVVNVAFLSPSLKLVDAACEVGNEMADAFNELSAGMSAITGDSLPTTDASVDCGGGISVFWTWLIIQLVLAAVAVGLHMMNKKAQ